MTPYRAIFSARFRTLLQYRGAAIAGFGTQLFWGLIRLMIFDAFYRSTTAAQPMSRDQVITYVWLGQAMLAMLPWSIDSEIRAMIRTGAVAYELVRPLDLYFLWYFRYLAYRTAPVLLRAVPMFGMAGLFFGLRAPVSMEAGFGWIATTLGALLLGCAFSNLVTVSLLWTISGEGISRFLPGVVSGLSGMLIPLPLLPDWAQQIIFFLPFRDLVDVPFRVYLGQIAGTKLFLSLLHQACWTLVLVALGRWLLSRAIHRLVIQGG